MEAQWRRTAVSAVLLAVVTSCTGPALRRGDLETVRAAGELRVIVRPGFLSSPLHGTGGVDEPALLRHLAARLGVRLRWVEAPRHDVILPWLASGRGDLAVARFSPLGLREAGFEASAAVAWVEDLLVRAPGREDGSARLPQPLLVHRSAWSGMLPEAVRGAAGAAVEPAPEELPLEEVVRRVRQGRWAATVADSALVEVVGGGPRGFAAVEPLGGRRPLVWALRPEDRALRAAVDRFLFAEQVLLRSRRTAACRDLEGVRRARVLRLITRNSPVTCSVERGGLAGYEYELASAFARRLGVRLELVIPPPEVDPLRWLEHGYGDLVAAHEPVGPEVRRRLRATRAYRHVDLVAVTSGAADPPAAVEDLGGLTVAASSLASELLALLPLDPPPVPLALPPGADALTALAQLERGNASVAVLDSDTARLELHHRPALRLGPTVLPRGALVWLLEPSARELAHEADRFLAGDGARIARELVRTELAVGRRWRPPHLADLQPGVLSPFDPLLREAASGYGLDWRLLASLMYEESRFDPGARGPGGSAGLFQLMPDTWRELAVRDPHDPAEAARAAARYLVRLMDEFAELEPADRVAMAIASYNVGPRHLEDARRLAGRMGLDADRWAGNVETAMVLLDDPEVARQFPAGVCRCRRAVGYTRRILRRYHAYAEQYALWDEPTGASVPGGGAAARAAAP